MNITVFAKKRTTADGRKFYSYLSTLTKKSGEQVVASVRFKEECGAPKAEECPINIVVNKQDCNFSKRKYAKPDGTEVDTYTLWINNWANGEPYVDHSMDDFE